MTEFETCVLQCNNAGLAQAADIIKSGGVVAVPTETVYGLAADATDKNAVKKIFKAKGRPADNPLIVHIADVSDVSLYAENVPDLAYKLFSRFSPGPLTIVLPKKSVIPDITSGGLQTVGIRIPADENCRRLIKLSGKAIAAPSANLSGKPSPTTAAHVFDDIGGKIPLILDGGECCVGIESTVISIEDGKIRILRPGFVTAEDLSDFAEVITDRGVTEKLSGDEPAKSPGMKYKHYSPECEVFLVDGTIEKFAAFFENEAYKGQDIAVLINKNDIPEFVSVSPEHQKNTSAGKMWVFFYGETPEDFARNIFSKLRKFDECGAERAYIHSPEKNGIGLAVYNRLIRAAGFRVISL